MQAFVDRFRDKASKARQAQSRMKMAGEDEADRVPCRRACGADPHCRSPKPSQPPLIALDRVSVGYVPGKPILSHLSLRIDPDDRIALLGKNGNGKSTLAKLLSGRLTPMAGEITRARKLRRRLFRAASARRTGRRTARALETLWRAPAAASTRRQVRTQLGGFGFSGDKADTRVAQSVGRRAGAADAGDRDAGQAQSADPRRADQPSRHRRARGIADGAERIRGRGRPHQPRPAPDRSAAPTGCCWSRTGASRRSTATSTTIKRLVLSAGRRNRSGRANANRASEKPNSGARRRTAPGAEAAQGCDGQMRARGREAARRDRDDRCSSSPQPGLFDKDPAKGEALFRRSAREAMRALDGRGSALDRSGRTLRSGAERELTSTRISSALS